MATPDPWGPKGTHGAPRGTIPPDDSDGRGSCKTMYPPEEVLRAIHTKPSNQNLNMRRCISSALWPLRGHWGPEADSTRHLQWAKIF
jgi:hypothetical protein